MRKVDVFIKIIRNVNESGLKVCVFLYGMLESLFYANGLFGPPSGLKPALKLHIDMYRQLRCYNGNLVLRVMFFKICFFP